MRLLRAIAPITLLVVASWTASAIAREVLGKQYVVLRSGPQPLADNEVLFLPCAPFNSTCKEVENKIDALTTEAKQKLDSAEGVVEIFRRAYLDCTPSRYSSCSVYKNKMKEAQIKHLKIFDYWLDSIKTASRELSQLKGTNSVRTDFEGNYSFECPTQNCLVYSAGIVGKTSSQWIEILPAGTKTDLSGKRGITVNLPDDL